MNTIPRSGESAVSADLLERYVREVGRHLPRAHRADVAAELRTLLRDQIEDRLAERPDADPQDVTIEVLREMGPPHRVARRYAPASDVWIGPELYPAFRTTAWIVVLVYSILTGLWAAGVFHGDVSLLPFHLEFDASRDWSDVMLGAIANVGIVALLFGVIERIARGTRENTDAWDPRTLPKVEDRDRISVAGEAVSLVATAFFAFVFNVAPDWLGLFMIRGDGWGPFPVLAPEYRVHLAWLNAWWAGAFALHLAVLARGRWRTWSRTAELLLGLFGALVLYRIVTGGPFTFLDVLAKPILAVALVVTLIVSVVRATRLLQRIFGSELEPAPQP